MVQLAIWILAAFVCGVAFICVWSLVSAIFKAIIADIRRSWTTIDVSAVKPQTSPTPPQPRLKGSLILRLHTLRTKQPIAFPRNPYPIKASPTATAVQDLLARPSAAGTR